MPNIQDTAYPRLKRTCTPHDLAACYTPTPADVLLVDRLTKSRTTKVCCLLALKTFQRLGYFLPLHDIPLDIVRHVAGAVGLTTLATDILAQYDQTNTSQRHRVAIRAHLRIQPYGPAARRVVVQAMSEAARTKHELADLVNVALEELVRQRYELPAFAQRAPALARAARRIRSAGTHRLYRPVFG